MSTRKRGTEIPEVTIDDVIAASERISALAKKTPVLTSRLIDEEAGCNIFFKCENLQRGGAFKIRGAMNFIAQLSDDDKKRGVVAFSSGNHAQAVACASAYMGVKATIVMPLDTPKAKLESTRSYQPEIVFYDRFREDREEIVRQLAAKTGAVVLPSYDHPWIIAGQATAALELLRQCADLDTVACPLGGGGLLSGLLVVARALRPGLRVFGVEPELADDWNQSLAKHERVSIPASETIADGLRTPSPGKLPFQIVTEKGGEAVTVSEAEIRSAVRTLLTRMKILVEPSGSVAAAAALLRKLPGARIGVILSGGNVDLDVLAGICLEGA